MESHYVLFIFCVLLHRIPQQCDFVYILVALNVFQRGGLMHLAGTDFQRGQQNKQISANLTDCNQRSATG